MCVHPHVFKADCKTGFFWGTSKHFALKEETGKAHFFGRLSKGLIYLWVSWLAMRAAAKPLSVSGCVRAGWKACLGFVGFMYHVGSFTMAGLNM